tara:strand:+ start:166 stop:387 length:222 start_codon:yes stop_codon:yes gene_type:complete
MKSIIIIINLLAITTINPIVNAHENHDHQIYSWSDLKNKTIKKDTTINYEKLENKKINAKTYNKSSWKKFFRR